MKEFMSLREFLLLKDSTDREPKRSVHRNEPMRYPRGTGITSLSEDYVNRYDTAKESWETYGEVGPPVGTKVEMLEAGHGGGVGVIRTMDGISNDPRFFEVYRIEESYAFGKKEKRVSLVCRETWFVHMRVHKE